MSNCQQQSCSSSSSSASDDLILIDPTVQTKVDHDRSSATTVAQENMGRLSLLPAYPSLHRHGVVVYHGRDHLLLANLSRSYPFRSLSKKPWNFLY